MAKRKNLVIVQNGDGVFEEVKANGPITVTPLGNLFAPAAGPEPAPSPSIEDRVAALEAKLAEAQSLNTRQAFVIVRASENAESLAVSRSKVKRLEDEADDAKKTAGECKKRYETAVSDHFELDERHTPRSGLALQ